MAMVAVTGDHRILVAVERRLQTHRHGFLADIEVAETADQAEAVKLARLFFEAADQEHLLVEIQQLFLGSLERLRFGGTLPIGNGGLAGTAWSFCHSREHLCFR